MKEKFTLEKLIPDNRNGFTLINVADDHAAACGFGSAGVIGIVSLHRPLKISSRRRIVTCSEADRRVNSGMKDSLRLKGLG